MRKIEHIKPDPVPTISWNWQEGRYWDLWMIVHTFSGTVCACVVALLGMPPAFGYPFILLVLTGWEIGEMVFGIDEELPNWILDIVFGMIGFWFVYEHVLPGDTFGGIIAVGTILLLSNSLFATLGWRSYRKRKV
jgi:hypothetical protein